MRIYTTLLLVSLLLCSFSNKDKSVPPHCKFHFESFKTLNSIPEPSDIVYDKASNHYYIVSDHGKLFECDLTGKVIRKADEEGDDFEGVEVTDSFVYISDETPRKIFKYKKSDLSLVHVYDVQWNGGLNKAFESITYNYTKKCFVLVSEMPVAIIEYDEHFKELSRQYVHIARDISSARWFKGEMYLLSDMDECIFKCDATTYAVKEWYKINVLNPEGLAFNDKDQVTITSDALQRIYFFNSLPIINKQ